MPNRKPLPTEAIRDLLGLTRALYGAAVDAELEPRQLEELRAIGIELVQVLELAKAPPGSMGQVAGWRRAESAARRIGEFVHEYMPYRLHDVLTVASRRVRGGRR